MTNQMWCLWALLLVTQNFAFTFVSRARNSGSLSRHMVAAIFSNGIFFIVQAFTVSAYMNIITGKYGMHLAIFACIFYTAFTLAGAFIGHYWSMRSEKGKSSVGASKLYAQIPIAEWEQVRSLLNPTSVHIAAPPAPDKPMSLDQAWHKIQPNMQVKSLHPVEPLSSLGKWQEGQSRVKVNSFICQSGRGAESSTKLYLFPTTVRQGG